MGGMIPHPEIAIVMAKLEVQRGSDGQITHIAGSIIASQTQDVAQMTAWLKEWYGSPRSRQSTRRPNRRALRFRRWTR